eukprot:6166711-Pleurochrysis_carterae.AAC.1
MTWLRQKRHALHRKDPKTTRRRRLSEGRTQALAYSLQSAEKAEVGDALMFDAAGRAGLLCACACPERPSRKCERR